MNTIYIILLNWFYINSTNLNDNIDKYTIVHSNNLKENNIINALIVYKEIKEEKSNNLLSKDINTLLFNSTCFLYNNTFSNILGTLFCSLLGFTGIFIYYKEFSVNEFINSLENNNKYYYNYIFYILYIFLNVFFYNNVLNRENEGVLSLFFMLGVLLVLIAFLKIIDLLVNWLGNIPTNNEKFKIILSTELVFAITFFIYWKYFTYPSNKKYFDRKIKPKFNQLSDYTILVNNNSNNLLSKKILYVEKEKEEEFKKEILSL
jgi:hypothetical protein